MYGIEKINIYTHNLSEHIYIDILMENIFINKKAYPYEEEKIAKLLNIIKLWNNNTNSSYLDDEKIEIFIQGNNFKENICAKTSNLRNYNEFRDWMKSYYE